MLLLLAILSVTASDAGITGTTAAPRSPLVAMETSSPPHRATAMRPARVKKAPPQGGTHTLSPASLQVDQPPPADGSAPAGASERNTPAKEPLEQKSRANALELSRPGKRSSGGGGPTSPVASLVTVGGSLAIVLTLFFLVAWLTKRRMKGTGGPLPKEVVHPLGHMTLALKQQLHLVRVGQKLLLLSVTPSGTETLTEIEEPAEVDRLAGLCQQNQPGSVTAAFRQMLSQLGTEEKANTVPKERFA